MQKSSLLAALRHSISRDEFFAGLYIIGCANGLLGQVLLSLFTNGWIGVLGVDVSVIVLFACYAGISTILEQRGHDWRSADVAVGVLLLILIALPIFALSWVAVIGLSFYILASVKSGSSRHRGALIMLALSVPMLWSKLLFAFFARYILQIDAALAATLLGTNRVGNLVGFADGSGYMVVLPACSSLTNMSLAFLCWVSVTQWAKHRWSPRDILWSLLVCVSVIAINVLRIALTGVSHARYEIIHSALGAQIFGFAILGVTVGISVLSARRELFSRGKMVDSAVGARAIA
jgi:exosortase/archaeosortase family protein